MKLRIAIWLWLSCCVGALAQPQVVKIEPPNWWANHSLNPVRVLMRGRNLQGARVSAPSGITASNIKINSTGTYLFADLRIRRNLPPGNYPLRLTTADGNATAPFEIAAPLPRAGNFQGFNQDDVIYLIMPDRFANGDAANDDPAISRGLFDRTKPRRYHGGDLQGIINKLPYLKDLGVTALWLNPVYDNNNQLDTKETDRGEPSTGYHGYGATDFYAVDEHLGDVAKFKELVQKAHALGLKVIQDQVANHCGPYHEWVKDSPTPTWFNGTEAAHTDENWQTQLLRDPHVPAEWLKPVLDGWFINLLPDLNQNDPEVARYLIQNTLWWLGATGLDAIRQDTLPYVPRRFWNEWMTAIKREYPNVNVVGETLDGSVPQVAFFQGGAKRWDEVDSKIDTEFDYPLFYAIRDTFAKGQSTKRLSEILSQDHLYPNSDALVTLLGSHDVNRFMSEQGATTAGLKLAFTFLLTTRGIPQLYYGDEIALPGGNDPDNRRDFPGGWAADGIDAFAATGRNATQNDVFNHLQKLLRLRKESTPLRRGKLYHLMLNEQTYGYARVTSTQTVIVVINNNAQPEAVEFGLPAEVRLAEGTTLRNLLNEGTTVKVESSKLKFTLNAKSAVILAQ
jgi:neopullulanase